MKINFKKYEGTKSLLASPMTRGDYNSYREWDIPKDENPNDLGYLVEYEAVEGKESNHSEHRGYISWSPADVFEKAYKTSETFFDRILIEAQELAIKTNGLNDFMRTNAFIKLDRKNKDLLYAQSRLMNEYLQILGSRIELLGEEFKF